MKLILMAGLEEDMEKGVGNKRTPQDQDRDEDTPASKLAKTEEGKENPTAGSQEEETAELYFTQEGRRWVTPYFSEFKAWAKQRWYGLSLIDLFTREFKAYPPAYYVRPLTIIVKSDPERH